MEEVIAWLVTWRKRIWSFDMYCRNTRKYKSISQVDGNDMHLLC